MSQTEAPDAGAAHLAVPAAKAARFKSNFIRQAVCELKFPTLYELEEGRPPKAFALALRKEYPNQAYGNQVKVGVGPVTHSVVHTFSSKKSAWTVTLRAASVSLETSNYGSFEEFKGRLTHVVQAAVPVIDSDFFTRVGLRYINTVPYTRAAIGEWVNPLLVGPLAQGIYGDPTECASQVTGRTRVGGYRLQHGIASIEGQLPNSAYVLDFDFFAEDVPVKEAIETVQQLKELEFSFFMWTLGQAARAELGPSII